MSHKEVFPAQLQGFICSKVFLVLLISTLARLKAQKSECFRAQKHATDPRKPFFLVLQYLAKRYHTLKSKKETYLPNDYFKQPVTMTNLVLSTSTIEAKPCLH